MADDGVDCSARIEKYVFLRCFSTLDQDLYRDIVRSGLQNTNNLLFLQSYVYRLFISFTIVQSHRISRTCLCPDTLARDTCVIQEDEFSLFSFLRQISNRESLSLGAIEIGIMSVRIDFRCRRREKNRTTVTDKRRDVCFRMSMASKSIFSR